MDLRLAFERLTGRHVLGPGVFWSTLAFGFLAHALGSSDLGPGNVLARLAGVTIAHLAMMAILLLTRFALFRLKASVSTLSLVIAGYVLAGAVRGLTLQIALFGLGAADSGYSNYRLIGGVVVMTTGLIWAALAFGIKAEWGAKRAALSGTKQQLESLLADSETRLESEASDTMSTIESMLQTALIPELMVTPQHAVVKLQSLINDTLRPLSAFLATSQPRIEVKKLDASVFKFKWTALFRHLRLRDASSPIPLALILSTLAVNAFLKYLPDTNPLVALGTSFLALASLLALDRYVISRYVDSINSLWRLPVILVTLFVTGLLGGSTFVLQHPGNQAMVDLAVYGAIWVALLGALFAINQSATVEISNIETQLSENEYRLRWTIAALNAQHWLQKKQFARKIHGPVQSEVAAAAIRIERSLSSGEVTELGEAALQNLRDRLARILKDTRGTSAVRPVLAEIAETWQGLCDVEIDLPEEVESTLVQDSVCVETVLEITREACSNAIRHGSADHIAITLDLEGCDLVRVRVENNGNRGLPSSRRGIGSAYLDDCTYSHELQLTEEGAVLTALVPFNRK